MADLVTRLLLNSSQFDNNIRQSTQQVQQFQAVGRSITSTIGKFAGGLGVAITASEAFNKAINSNKSVQDKFKIITEGATQTVNDFFSALTTGDWSVFDGGISNAIKKGQIYISTLKNLKAALSIGQYTADELEAERDKAEVKLTQEGLSKEERKQGYEDFIKYGQAYIDQLKNTYNYSWEQLNAALRAKSIKFDSTEDVKKAYQQYLNPSTEQYAMLEQYKKDKAKLESLGTAIRGNAGQYDIYYRTPEAKAYQKEFEAKYEGKGYENLIRFQNLFTEENAEMFQGYIDNIVQFNQRLAEANKTLADGKVDYQKTLKEENDNLQKTLEENKKKTFKDNEASIFADNWLNEELYGLHDDLVRKARGLDPVQITYELAPINEENPDELPLPTQLVTTEDVNNISAYTEGLNGIATMMGAITNLTNEGAAAWISWTATVLSSVAAAIPAIQTLVTAKTAEAGASAAASAAQVPVVGWILAGAAVASVLASLAALPKFSEGGIFNGNNTIGDFNLARVNSGEMILNNRQQRNLFNLLNGNTGTLRNNSEVTFKIQGKELVGVLNNYNNKISKVK